MPTTWLRVVAIVVALYVICQGTAAVLFGVVVETGAVPVDLALHAVAAALLFAVSRRFDLFVALLTLSFAALHLGMAAKIAVFGGPVTPDDLVAAPALFLILPLGQQIAAAALAVTVIVLLAINASFGRRRGRRAALVAAAIASPFVLAPGMLVQWLDATFDHVEWNQRRNYETRGPLLYVLHEQARHAAQRAKPPSRGAVADAIGTLVQPLQPAAFSEAGRRPLRKRNVHVIMMESFWDPALLTALDLSRDPWVPAFRTLWEAGGRSRALSPVFGGYTANAEFEALCGLPVDRDGVVFEGRLRNDAPCLPRHLSEQGYETVASHPNIASFWNRVHAYRRVGFTTYWSERDFVADDLNGAFLSDASLYRQVLGKIEALLETGTPLFNYVLTLSGHLDYPLSAARPAVITAEGADELVVRYVNTVHYKTVEVIAVIAELRARDPDAVIVVAGDHLPYLGDQFGPYVESGLLAGRFEDFTPEMWLTLVATPLIVIDGRNGPVKVGTIPMYRLPAVVLDLLDDRQPSLLRLAALVGRDGLTVRPLPGLALALRDDGTVRVCRSGLGDAACERLSRWQALVNTVTADVLWGRQHMLKEAMPAGDTTPVLFPPPDA